MSSPHVLAIPYPAQGHVIPLLEFVQNLAKHGFRITFVNTEVNHKRIVDALSGKDDVGDHIHLVSIPDGLEPWENRSDMGTLSAGIAKVMPEKLGELIEKINRSHDDKITCVIADVVIGWALEIAEKKQIRRAAFCPAAATILALSNHIPKLLDDGILNHNGIPMKNHIIRLSPTMPAISIAQLQLAWASFEDLPTQKAIFEVTLSTNRAMRLADRLICNSSYELEPAAFELHPNILPIGPLLASNRLGNSAGYFWPEDSTCLEWLNQQPAQSIIYVAFGSLAVFDQEQFQELALGLELTNSSFLWVVRSGLTDEINDAYPKGFKERVANRGRMVGWAPQQEVLGHPSIACFLSHCGWNSTLEGISNGIPFLCWPCDGDQLVNQIYICDVWKVGLGFNRDDGGIIKRGEIKDRVEQLLLNKTFKSRSMDLKDVVAKGLKEGGCSHKNFKDFITWMKA